ncbi:M15 family metallopeptidase [Curtobacterium sp. A7_M15]|uniref:M15 family metallopeptidase n=1 Tax=Curtobacterium sp. A7_M15 TaxID=3065241 RepID=UPI002737A6E0|nr:M15 family metallopeptidase [Curtobacterium sp. A7_M15]MDP4333239.1 M15 family metallopeptidase [Curtobacterium sp. A7_M15]
MPTNGLLNTSALVTGLGFRPIEDGAGGLLRPDVARQHNLMAAQFERDLGEPLLYSEGYRSLARQNLKWSQYQHGGTLAAFPGTSTHGLAVTIDYASGVGYPTTEASRWMDEHGPAYGFIADVPSERWHRHFAVTPTITAVPHTAALHDEQEEPDMIILSNGKGQGLLTGKTLTGIPSTADVQALVKAGVPSATVSREFYAKLQRELGSA